MITSFSTIFRSLLQLKTENALNGFETLKPTSHIFNLMTGRIQCPWYKFVRSNTTIAKQNSTVLVSAGGTSAPLYDFMTNDQVVLPGRSTVDVRTMAHIIKAVILFCHVLNCQISPVDLVIEKKRKRISF